MSNSNTRILFIVQNPRQFRAVFARLRSQSVDVRATGSIRTGLALVVQFKPTYVFVSVSVHHPRIVELPLMLEASFSTVSIVLSEETGPLVAAKLQQTKAQNIISGPLTVDAFTEALQKASSSKAGFGSVDDATSGMAFNLNSLEKDWTKSKRYGGEKIVVKQRQKIEDGHISVELTKAVEVAKSFGFNEVTAEELQSKNAMHEAEALEVELAKNFDSDITTDALVTTSKTLEDKSQHLNSEIGLEKEGAKHVGNYQYEPPEAEHVKGQVSAEKYSEHIDGKLESQKTFDHVTGQVAVEKNGTHVTGHVDPKQETTHATGAREQIQSEHVGGFIGQTQTADHVTGASYVRPQLNLVKGENLNFEFENKIFEIEVSGKKYLCLLAFEKNSPISDAEMFTAIRQYLIDLGKVKTNEVVDMKIEPTLTATWAQDFVLFFKSIPKDPNAHTLACISETEKILEQEEVVQKTMRRISIHDLPPNVSLPTDIFIYLPRNDKYIMYARQKGQVTSAQLDHLMGHTQEVFVNVAEFSVFKKFIVESTISLSMRSYLKKAA